MEYLVFLGGIMAYIIFATVCGIHTKKKEQLLFIQQLKEGYGSYPVKQHTLEQYERISHFTEYKHKNFPNTKNYCDEITWNDLELERIFQAMNHTYSSAGEEYLYHMLHTPLSTIEEVEARNKRVTTYQQDESLRIQLLTIFKELGTTGKFSIVDYLEFLGSVSKTNNFFSYGLNGLFVASILLIFVDGLMGAMFTIAMICIQMGRYFKRKKEIEPFFVSVAYLLRLLHAGQKIVTVKHSDMEPIQEEIRHSLKQLKALERNTSFICGNGSTLSNNGLGLIIDYINMLVHLDLIQFNKVLSFLNKESDVIFSLLESVGSIEAELAIAYYRAWLPYYTVPNFLEECKMSQEDLYLPLVEDCVSNSIETNKSILITGSNASGKSTFLRAVGINAILAQTIATCSAKSVQMPLMCVYSSIAIRDNLAQQDSYYLAEIKSIKRILTVAEDNKLPVLCFIDEVLRGTNTIERIAASTQILKMLGQKGVICFAATHDIELTQLLKEEYDNYHFQEEMNGDDITFSYMIQKGPATSRNAIFLLKTMGYDSKIIENAMEMANGFLEKGVWS